MSGLCSTRTRARNDDEYSQMTPAERLGHIRVETTEMERAVPSIRVRLCDTRGCDTVDTASCFGL